jgi:hypothetical protein
MHCSRNSTELDDVTDKTSDEELSDEELAVRLEELSATTDEELSTCDEGTSTTRLLEEGAKTSLLDES